MPTTTAANPAQAQNGSPVMKLELLIRFVPWPIHTRPVAVMIPPPTIRVRCAVLSTLPC